MSPKVEIPAHLLSCNNPLWAFPPPPKRAVWYRQKTLHHKQRCWQFPPLFRKILPENCCTISQAQKMLFAAKFAVGGGLCSRTSLSNNRRAEKIIIIEVFFASAFFLSFCLLWFGHSFLRSAFHTAAIVCGFSCSLKLWVRYFMGDSFVPKRSLISPWIVILVKEPLKPRPKQEGK